MFIRMLAGTVLVLLATGLTTVQADKPTDREEFRAVVTSGLEGRWGTNNITFDGTTQLRNREGVGFVVLLIFQGNKYSWLDFPDPERDHGTEVEGGKYAACLVNGVGEIDINISRGRSAGQTTKGIFKVEGDTLTICLGGKDRPRDFESKEGSGRILWVLKRLRD
jgi:uncharacterized protein (TIGR03067 family)